MKKVALNGMLYEHLSTFSPIMNDPNETNDQQHDSNARALKYLAFYLLVGLALTWAFNQYLSDRHNPNKAPLTETELDGSQVVVLKRNPHGHYVTNGKINGVDVQFLLDTGATQVSIPEEIANTIGLQKGSEFLVSTANGIAPVYATQIDSIELGGIKLYNIYAHINPNVKDEDILLGMSFLKHLEFSQRGKQLTLRQVP